MYYKLYHNTFSEHPPEERRELFAKLYQQYEVELIGVFRDLDNPLNYYMITSYRDETHYKEFIAAIKQIPEYVAMTQRVSELRIANSVVNLEKL